MEPHPYPAQPTRVIHLKGKGRQLGHQHAEQVGPACSLGMVKLYYEYWQRHLMAAGASLSKRLTHRVLAVAIDQMISKKLLASIPAEYLERLEGISETAGIPLAQVQTAVVLPDLMPMLQALLVKVQPNLFIEGRALPTFGCTSFVSSGERFFHARNLDFPGVSYWDRYPVIQLTERPNALRYIGFCSAGVPISGISGINEAQISVALHQHYCKRFTTRGIPPFVVGEQILSKAKNLAEAVDVLESHRVATSWAFIVTDGKTRESFICETHPNAKSFRRLGPENKMLAHSNYFQTETCRTAEYCTSARMALDNQWRTRRLEYLVGSAGSSITPEMAASFISDQWDGFWNKEKVINRVVGLGYNIQSYVLDSEQMKIYFAEGDSPVQLRSYREYDLGKIFAGESGKTNNVFGGYRFQSEGCRQSKEWYTRGLVQYFEGDDQAAVADIRKALLADRTPELAYIAGQLELRLKNYSNAHNYFQMGKEEVEKLMKETGKTAHPPEYFEITLYLARTLDLLGQGGAAKALYQSIASAKDQKDENIRTLAAKTKPYRPRDVEKIVTPFSSYVPFY